MPVISIDMTGGRTVEQKRELVRVFTQEFCRICSVKPEVVTVVIREIADEHWAMGGKTRGQQKEEQARG